MAHARAGYTQGGRRPGPPRAQSDVADRVGRGADGGGSAHRVVRITTSTQGPCRRRPSTNPARALTGPAFRREEKVWALGPCSIAWATLYLKRSAAALTCCPGRTPQRIYGATSP